ncbi:MULTISPECIES: hypothetical protein [unclassified Kribbella]|uniref:hypothetical protein n=1 Tax=unclassified Kribbella TaxID=2644121 RepID=UPI0033CEBCC5
MTPTTNHRLDVSSPPAEGVAGTARDEAGQLKETSTEAARQVAGTVKDKASEVKSGLGHEARRMAGQTRDELVQQTSQQKERATQSLRSIGDELRGMAEHGQSGLGAQLAQRGAEFTDQAAEFLQNHEPGDLLEQVRGYARRKPGTFLLAAAAAGIVAGRLTRALAAGGSTASTPDSMATGNGAINSVGDDYPVPPASTTFPPVAPTSAPPPAPTPVAPDPDPGAPVTPRFSPGSGQ